MTTYSNDFYAHDGMITNCPYKDENGVDQMAKFKLVLVDERYTKPNSSTYSNELRPNYCFFCGAYGKENKDYCKACLSEIGTYPPEVSQLIEQATKAAEVRGRKYAWSQVLHYHDIPVDVKNSIRERIRAEKNQLPEGGAE